MNDKKSALTILELFLMTILLGILIAFLLSMFVNMVIEKQNKTPYKKSISILKNAIENIKSENRNCYFTGDNNNIKLAECINNSLQGELKGNQIRTIDGITYYFMPTALNYSGTIENVCGTAIGETEEDWMGEKNCKVVVDVNGLDNASRDFLVWESVFIQEPKDQFLLIMSSNAIKPSYIKGYHNKGYEYFYGNTNSPF